LLCGLFLVVSLQVGGTVFLWHEEQGWNKFVDAPGTVSIIVPAYNEEKGLQATLNHLKQLSPAPHEIIVVDGGSSDRTTDIAKRCGVKVLKSSKGRARQMNAGAAAATGDLLCFVHADSTPPVQTVAVVRGVLSQHRTVLGAFRTTIEDEGRRLHFMTWHHLIKTYYVAAVMRPLSFVRGIRCLFGDQNLFCRAQDFKAVGGYQDDLPIMEDVQLCIKLHMAGPNEWPHAEPQARSQIASEATMLAQSEHGQYSQCSHPARSHPRRHRRGRVRMVLAPAASTSGRRLSSMGNVKATFVHFIVALRWYFGASPEQMYEVYNSMYGDQYR
jgi:rSAM/selenodomain-associated transferase 2